MKPGQWFQRGNRKNGALYPWIVTDQQGSDGLTLCVNTLGMAKYLSNSEDVSLREIAAFPVPQKS